MANKDKNPFKTVVFSRSELTDVISFILPFCLFVFIIFSANPDLSRWIDVFLSGEKVYADIISIGDNESLSRTIIESYSGFSYKEKEKNNIDTPTPTPSTEEIKITERTASVSSKINNQTNIPVDILEFDNKPLYYKADNKKPSVLIIHTHTTESYFDKDRNLDDEKNMIKIGKVIAEKLKKGGVKVIHNTTVHDYPSYSGAYTRSYATVSKELSENPDINVILDIHRDAVSTEDGKKVSLVSDINGKKTAQIMFVVGTDSQLTHENWKENLNLAIKLQNKANMMYPGLTRPINIREQRFNQQASKGSIIVEVGANGNALDEAILSAERLSEVLLEVL